MIISRSLFRFACSESKFIPGRPFYGQAVISDVLVPGEETDVAVTLNPLFGSCDECLSVFEHPSVKNDRHIENANIFFFIF